MFYKADFDDRGSNITVGPFRPLDSMQAVFRPQPDTAKGNRRPLRGHCEPSQNPGC